MVWLEPPHDRRHLRQHLRVRRRRRLAGAERTGFLACLRALRATFFARFETDLTFFICLRRERLRTPREGFNFRHTDWLICFSRSAAAGPRERRFFLGVFFFCLRFFSQRLRAASRALKRFVTRRTRSSIDRSRFEVEGRRGTLIAFCLCLGALMVTGIENAGAVMEKPGVWTRGFGAGAATVTCNCSIGVAL